MARFPHHFHVNEDVSRLKIPPRVFTCFSSRKVAEVYAGVLARMAKDIGLIVKGNKETGFLVGKGDYLSFRIEVIRVEGSIDDCPLRQG